MGQRKHLVHVPPPPGHSPQLPQSPRQPSLVSSKTEEGAGQLYFSKSRAGEDEQGKLAVRLIRALCLRLPVVRLLR